MDLLNSIGIELRKRRNIDRKTEGYRHFLWTPSPRFLQGQKQRVISAHRGIHMEIRNDTGVIRRELSPGYQ